MRFPCRVKKSCAWRGNSDQEARLVHEFSHYAGFSEEKARIAVRRLTDLVDTCNRGRGYFGKRPRRAA